MNKVDFLETVEQIGLDIQKAYQLAYQLREVARQESPTSKLCSALTRLLSSLDTCNDDLLGISQRL
jgi:hypothetical protein